jgi:hypothetical protein
MKAKIVVFALALSCGEQSPAQSPTEWPFVLSAMPSGTTIFAPQLIGPPPTGRRLHLTVHQRTADQACRLYGQSRPEGRFWYLDVITSSSEAGRYDVVPDLPSQASGALATVRAREVVDGKKTSNYAAIEGSVTISPGGVGPSQTVVGELRVAFQQNPLMTVECRGGQAPGEAAQTECTCEDSEGRRSVCTPVVVGQNCCLQASGGPTVPLEMSFAASFCADLCTFTDPALARYCTQ